MTRHGGMLALVVGVFAYGGDYLEIESEVRAGR